MKTTADPNGLVPGSPKATGLGPSLASAVEREDLEARLGVVRRKERRHLLWTVLGVSPGAVIPALGLLREGNTALLLLLSGLVVVSQGYSWARAAREAERLEKQLQSLSKPE